MFLFDSFFTVCAEIFFVAIPFFYALRLTRWYPTISKALLVLVGAATTRPSRRGGYLNASASTSSVLMSSSYIQERQQEPDCAPPTHKSDLSNDGVTPTAFYRQPEKPEEKIVHDDVTGTNFYRNWGNVKSQ